MNRILSVLTATTLFLLISNTAFSQINESLFTTDNAGKWSLGLYAGPVFTKAYNQSYNGFSIQPGLYYSSGRMLIGAVPYFARFSNDFQGSFYDPADQRTESFTYAGLDFHARYYFGSGRFRPYANAFIGGGAMWQQLERKPQYGGNVTYESMTINLGIGAGATYRLNNSILMDLKVEQGFIRHIDFGSWNQYLMPSIGIFWQF